jgi:hypothetical protein
MFLSFADYQAMGGELEQADFTQAEFIARQKINEMTHNRIDTVTENVKMCVFGLIERGYLGSLDGNDYISQGSGRLSETRESLKGKAESFIRTCLSDTPNLFYAGNQ